MAEIIRAFADPVPAMRFIGKKYGEIGHWGDWFAGGWFDVIEQTMGGVEAITRIWENGGGYVGLERRKDGELAEYWIGMFTPQGTAVPEGFECVDFPASSLGTCWICGKEWEVHGAIGQCGPALAEAGIQVRADGDGTVWSFENGLCPRFTTPDEKGNVILDYCFYSK